MYRRDSFDSSAHNITVVSNNNRMHTVARLRIHAHTYTHIYQSLLYQNLQVILLKPSSLTIVTDWTYWESWQAFAHAACRSGRISWVSRLWGSCYWMLVNFYCCYADSRVDCLPVVERAVCRCSAVSVCWNTDSSSAVSAPPRQPRRGSPPCRRLRFCGPRFQHHRRPATCDECTRYQRGEMCISNDTACIIVHYIHMHI